LEKLVIAGYALSCLGFIGYLLIQKPLDLFFVQIIFGIGEAVSIPAFDGLYSMSLDKGKFASEWGLWESMDFIVAGVAAIAGGLLANLYGFNFLFTIMLILSILGLLISFFLLSKKKK
jgi:MFS family permease